MTAKGTAGEACLAMGEYISASHNLQQSLTAALSAGSKRDETWALILLGETDLRQGQAASVLTYLSQALDIARQVGLRSEEARCHELLAEIYEKQGDLKQVVVELRLFHQIKQTLYNEDTANRIANLQVIYQVEKAKRDTVIQYLKTIELERELEERKKTNSVLEKLTSFDPLTEVLNRPNSSSLLKGRFNARCIGGSRYQPS